MLAFQNIKHLGRVVSMQSIKRLHENPKATELVLITALQLNDFELINVNQIEHIY
jgi:hypothetical protein